MGATPERLSERVAAIDIGTNSVLLLIAARNSEGRLTTLVERATVTRLGRGVDAERRLQPEAMQRTLDVLAAYAAEASAWQAKILAVGTSALRDAANAAEFRARAEGALGVAPEVIEGAREAQLTFAGALVGLPVVRSEVTVVDVGGGSTELVRARGGLLDSISLDSVSIDMGAVRMTERFALTAPTSSAACAEVLAHATAALRVSGAVATPSIVAVAGTATTLAAIAGAVDPFDPARIHGTRLSIDELRASIERLAALDLDQRAAVPGLGPARADVIIGGAIVLLAACEHARARELIVSCGGLRVGLAAEALGLSL
jgi:exopolyphosphatase/guanosine-5'-triphosphate,3'-diphosphate pyrophosphatase